MPALTIGMATYNDFDGVYFTLQALRLYQDLDDVELLVVDNFGCKHTRRLVEGLPGARYLLATDVQGTAAPRDLVFREARGAAVLCLDSHVLLEAGVIARLKAYYRDHPQSIDLLQGPLLNDSRRHLSTHFEPVWREQMWGTWSSDPRGQNPDGEPFEIPMQGLGVFSCRRAAWPGFNPAFRGFGGEEGYLHEKFRQRGGRCLCLPWLRWIHRFARPAGVPYRLTVEDKVRNYVIGHAELGLDLEPIRQHFAAYVPEDRMWALTRSALHDQYVASLPLVSCICATYNRPPGHQHLIEEAIESFLRQTYPHKELLVINDTPGQELVCDAPGVRVINVPERFPGLGQKHNAGVALARGALIANWDDDDISLPWRLSLSVERLADADYYNPRTFWYMVSGDVQERPVRNYGHNLSLLRRSAFDAVGGYPLRQRGVDKAIAGLLRADPNVRWAPDLDGAEIAREDLFYIYRWGVSPHHLSGSPHDDHWDRIAKRPVTPGQFVLRPHWRQDYELTVRHALAGPPRSKAARHENCASGSAKGRRKGGKPLVYIVGVDNGHRRARPFPMLRQEPGESAARHVDRVMRAVDEAIIGGGTHLLVPRDAASWLNDSPLLENYFATYHDLVEANAETGIVFDLCRVQLDT